MSSDRHTVMFSASFRGFGNFPELTPFHQAVFEIGIIAGMGGVDFLSPMICLSLKNLGLISILSLILADLHQINNLVLAFGHKLAPVFHQMAAFFEKIPSPVSRFHLIANFMR